MGAALLQQLTPAQKKILAVCMLPCAIAAEAASGKAIGI